MVWIRTLGRIGDARTIEPLIQMASDPGFTDGARAFALTALGGVADKADLPWNDKLSRNVNYLANPATLTHESARGVLDIL